MTLRKKPFERVLKAEFRAFSVTLTIKTGLREKNANIGCNSTVLNVASFQESIR